MENKEIENAINELIRLKKILLVQLNCPKLCGQCKKASFGRKY